jgi:hypothetical protein
MKPTHPATELSTVQEAIIKTLLYYDIFNYPLTGSEIFRFCQLKETQDEVDIALHELVQEGHLFKFDELYSIQNDHSLIKRRLSGNDAALKMLPVAQRQAKLIASFPFVRGVMASGSLSKGYIDEESDLDFFIVTEPGRLWIARTLLALYKRVMLGNSHKRFCINYFIDSAHLTIEEKNLFTATELATVIPLFSYSLYTELHHHNMWLKKFFPNYETRSSETEVYPGRKPITKILEFLLQPFAYPLERLSMAMTFSRWKKLYGDYHAEDFKIAFKTTRHVSKNHPRHFQKKVMERYHEKLIEFSNTSGIALV